MDSITKLISYISPKLAANRMRSQVTLRLMDEAVRKFDGAGHGRRFNNWGDNYSTQNQQIATALHTLRSRSRDMIRNNGYAKNAIRRIGNNVVGTGILATPVSKNPNQAAAKIEDELVKGVWKAWAENTDCDFDGMQNFYGIQKMVVKTVAKSGACIVRKVWKKYKKGAMSLELQVLEPDFLDRTKNGQIMDNGEYTFNGIQFDKNNKRIAYWIYDMHPYETKIQSRPVPADDIAYVMDLEDPGQVDGLPFNSSIIVSMNDFSEYTDAQLMKQKVSAAHAGFITSDEASIPSNSNTSTNGIAAEDIEPGTLHRLANGESITFSNPPTTEGFSDYFRYSSLGHAAGWGLSYEAYTGDLKNVNFSSGRMGWIEYHRNVEDWQWNMTITMLCGRVWQWFTKAAYMSGLIPDANIGVTWTPPRREMIDPVKEGKALAELVRNGFMSWQNAVRSLGYNPEDVLEEMKKDAAAFDLAKLMPASDPRYDDTRINDPMTPQGGKLPGVKPLKAKKKPVKPAL
jgi:lambda family phage portal protein